MGLFITVALTVWGAMHAYVFWRLSSIPWVEAHTSRAGLVSAALALWASYPAARILESERFDTIAEPLELVAANWMGVLFLLMAAFLAVDIVTAGGWLLRSWVPAIRGYAALAGLALAVVALIQGARPPVVRDHEVALAGLQPQADGLVLVQVSDLHLGSVLGRRWCARIIERLNAMKPDLLVLVGDVVDGNAERMEQFRPLLASLKARFGVFAVTGNHEYYAGVDRCVQLFDQCGWVVLRDRWVEPRPGLILAGVDDLTARRQFRLANNPLSKALAGRPPGATILLSHSPWQAESAAAARVGLMLSGHTHNGQVWPFNYLVATRYPFISGRYNVAGMAMIVSRGAGTWGPRMRLWQPSEIVRITLRRAD